MYEYKETWSMFRIQYVETGWFDFDRTKTLQAMRQLFERVPEEVRQEWPQITVFAPSAQKLGELLPVGGTPNDDALFIYLAPELEKLSQDEVDYIVAHEFAHVTLKHATPGASVSMTPEEIEKLKQHSDAPTEVAADNLTLSWGFRKSEATR